jgi:hypothetical protein
MQTENAESVRQEAREAREQSALLLFSGANVEKIALAGFVILG